MTIKEKLENHLYSENYELTQDKYREMIDISARYVEEAEMKGFEDALSGFSQEVNNTVITDNQYRLYEGHFYYVNAGARLIKTNLQEALARIGDWYNQNKPGDKPTH